MIRTRTHLRVLVAAAVMLSACGGASDDTSSATPAKTTPGGASAGTGGAGTQSAGTQSAGTQSAGHDLLSFSAPAIGGGSVEGAEFRGRPTLLWFWSPW